jgi:phage terminase small subunit
MPRRSAASSQIFPLPRPQSRVRPPSTLPIPERDLFVELVAANPANHFRPSDMPLLVQYCAAVVLGERAAAELRQEPVIDGKASPWLVVFEKCSRATIALAMRLRLSPQARAPNNPTRSAPQLSAYEKMRLHDEEAND